MKILIIFIIFIKFFNFNNACITTASSSNPAILSETNTIEQQQQTMNGTTLPGTSPSTPTNRGVINLTPSPSINNNISIIPPLGCQQCRDMLTVRRNDVNSRNIGQSLERENTADGCEELTISCFGNSGDTALIVSYFNSSGSDVGTTFGTISISTTLRCNDNSKWTISGNFSSASTEVDELECIST